MGDAMSHRQCRRRKKNWNWHLLVNHLFSNFSTNGNKTKQIFISILRTHFIYLSLAVRFFSFFLIFFFFLIQAQSQTLLRIPGTRPIDELSQKRGFFVCLRTQYTTAEGTKEKNNNNKTKISFVRRSGTL